MKKFLTLLVVLISHMSYAQQDAWVYFNNKPNSQYYFDNPTQMLSQRALDRRAAQNIALDLADVPIHVPYVTQVDAAPNITVMASSKWLNAVHIRGSVAAINALSLLPFVSSIDFADESLNSAGRMVAQELPAVVQNALVDFPYGDSANQIQMLNGHLLHQQNFTGSGKIIAVLDAGFPEVDAAQPFQRLWNNNLLLGGYNFVDRNLDIYSRNNHGTMVLSTMGGYKANSLVGTAPDAEYYLFITEDIYSENPVEESYWVEAAEMADSLGVDVINTSLGYFTYDNPAYSYTYADLNGITSVISRGAEVAYSRGMVVVVSAGNSGETENPHISVPADAVNVLTVGAVTGSEAYASFSSIGPTPDGRVKPDVVARGHGARVANTSGNIVSGNGTSFAGPIIAGMVASFWQAVPDLTNAQVMQFVKESAHLYQNPTPQLGYGIPDFNLALANALSVESHDALPVAAYPNPFSDHVSFAMPDDQTATVSLYNTLGQLVMQRPVHANEHLETSQLSEGVYYYRLQYVNQIRNGKLIKQ